MPPYSQVQPVAFRRAVSGAQISFLRAHCGPFHAPVLRTSSSQVSAAREHSAQAGPQCVPAPGLLAAGAGVAGAGASDARTGSLGSAVAAGDSLLLTRNGSRSPPYLADADGPLAEAVAHPPSSASRPTERARLRLMECCALMRDTPAAPDLSAAAPRDRQAAASFQARSRAPSRPQARSRRASARSHIESPARPARRRPRDPPRAA